MTDYEYPEAPFDGGTTFGDPGGSFGDYDGTFGDLSGGAESTTYPTLTVEMAFGASPLDEDPAWTVVTEYVLHDPGVNIGIGRNPELGGRYSPLTAGFSLLNSDRRFDPLNTSGTYYGQIKPNTPCRITASYPNVAATASFAYTGAEQTFVVPAGVNRVTIVADGAAGGPGTVHGLGARVWTTLEVDPGETLYIEVGGQGGSAGGWNGGGAPGSGTTVASRGGGGATDVRKGGNSTGHRVIVAAGGGGEGGSASIAGGDGGALDTTADSGGNGSGACTGGAGASQSDPGIGGIKGGGAGTNNGADGTLGGTGGAGGSLSTAVAAAQGGGGGGGWNGGGGGGAANSGGQGAGGGGGASWVDASVTSGTISLAGQIDGNGALTLVYVLSETLFYGWVDQWRQQWDVNTKNYTCEVSCTSITKHIARRRLTPRHPWIIGGGTAGRLGTGNQLSGSPTFARERSGARVKKVLDTLGIPDRFRDLDPGKTPLLADTPDPLVDALEYLETINRSEYGRLYTTGDGRLRFEERRAWSRSYRQRTVNATLTDSVGSSYRFAGVEFAPEDDTEIRTVVERGNTAGVVIRKIDEPAVTANGWALDSQTDLLVEDPLSLNSLAGYALLKQAESHVRIERLVLKPARLGHRDALFPLILGLRIGDRLAVQCTPRGTGSQISVEVWVEGIYHQFTHKDWTTTLVLVEADSYQFLTLNGSGDTAKLSSGNVLGY